MNKSRIISAAEGVEFLTLSGKSPIIGRFVSGQRRYFPARRVGIPVFSWDGTEFFKEFKA